MCSPTLATDGCGLVKRKGRGGDWTMSGWKGTVGGRGFGKGRKDGGEKERKEKHTWKRNARAMLRRTWWKTGLKWMRRGRARVQQVVQMDWQAGWTTANRKLFEWPVKPNGLELDPIQMRRVLAVYLCLLWLFGYSVVRQVPELVHLLLLNARASKEVKALVQELEETLEKKAELDRLEEEPVAGPGIKLIWVPPPEEPTSKAKEIWRAIDRYLPGGYYRMVQQKLRESERIPQQQAEGTGRVHAEELLQLDKWSRKYAPLPRQYEGVGVRGSYFPRDWTIRDGEEKFPDWASGKDLNYVPSREEVNKVVKGLDPGYGPPMYVYKWKRHYEIADIFPEETDRKRPGNGRVMQEDEDFLLMLDLENPRIQKLLSQKETLSDIQEANDAKRD